jgi:molybdopterin converting factor small subunit
VVYDVATAIVGSPISSQIVLNFLAPRAFTLSALTSGVTLVGKSQATATAQTDFLVKKNGATIATIRFAASASNGYTIANLGATAIAAGDVITIVAPVAPDATLSDIAFALPGTV